METRSQTGISGRSESEKTATPAIDRLAGTVRQTVDRITHTAAPSVEWLENSVHKLNQSGIKMMEDGKQCIRDYPFATVGAALAIGALLGFLARTRH